MKSRVLEKKRVKTAYPQGKGGGAMRRRCDICGFIFTTNPEEHLLRMIGLKPRCPNDCGDKPPAGYKKGWRRKLVERQCIICKAFFPANKNAEGKFCSATCRIENGKVTKKCLTCGNDFKAPIKAIKKGNGKFCSRSCSAIHKVKHCKKKGTGIELKVKAYLD